MISNKESMQIAIDVWGDPVHEVEYKSKVLTQGMVDTSLNPTALQCEVHSWVGFGKTMKAVGEQNRKEDNNVLFNTVYMALLYNRFITGYLTPMELWTKTYKTVLGAIKR